MHKGQVPITGCEVTTRRARALCLGHHSWNLPPVEPVLRGGLLPKTEPGTPLAWLPVSGAKGIQRGFRLRGEEQTAGSWEMLVGGGCPAILGCQTRV